jgi:hypothetical protein
MSESPEASLTIDDHRQAFTEVSFLLDIFAATIDNLMGGATASVGRIAGRHMAKNLPLYLADPKLPDVLTALAEHMQAGFDITFQCEDKVADITFGRCVIREVCKSRNLPLGGELCRLFHFYTDGMVNELCQRPAKSSLTSSGEQCRSRMDVR